MAPITSQAGQGEAQTAPYQAPRHSQLPDPSQIQDESSSAVGFQRPCLLSHLGQMACFPGLVKGEGPPACVVTVFGRNPGHWL